MALKFPFLKLFSRLPAKAARGRKNPDAGAARPSLPELKLIFFIVDWNQANVVSGVFVEEKVRFHFISMGMGTANSDILDLLGIGAGEKAIVICLEQQVMVPVLMKEVRKKLSRSGPGAGITFTVPLSAINDPVLLIFKRSIHKNEKIAAEQGLLPPGEGDSKDEGGNMKDRLNRDSAESDTAARDTVTRDAVEHDLIMAVVNYGYSDELMNTAREAGASGGTVLNARGQAHEGAVRFLGISVQDEKEIILMLTSREKKVSIMRSICEAHGLNSKAQGIVFSLPVDNVMGLNFE
ncbi:MAG: P-II family nitrogen regulator [Treponema sp.]|nr:P-II family nitrogen regulator [Treponema sp.]